MTQQSPNGSAAPSKTATEALVLPAQHAAAPLVTEASQALEFFRGVNVDSLPMATWAADAIKTARKKWQDIDALRKSFTAPLRDLERRINDFFKPALEHYEGVQQVLNAKMSTFHQAQAAQQQAAVAQVQATLQAGQVPTGIIPAVELPKGTHARVMWSFRVVNESLVPRELCSPDPHKIEAARSMWMQGSEAPPAISGVEWVKEERTVSR